MRQYCSVCKSQYEMTVVSEAGDDGVVWLKCPQCEGILPYMPPEAGEAGSADGDTAVEAAPAAITIDDIDPETARIYSPQETYEIGDVLHHRGWNDYGTVVAKETLPGNRQMIRVRFTQNGEVQLIEGSGA